MDVVTPHPGTVTLAFYGGPADWTTQPWSARKPVPEQIAGTAADGEFGGGTYQRSHTDRDGWWVYVWIADQTGRKNPCRAGCAEYPGARCPSGQARQQPA